MGDLKDKLTKRQNEYFELLIKIINNDDSIITEDEGYNDSWERLQELQRDIIIFTTMYREQKLDIAKEQLERAFTPRIKMMLSSSLSSKETNESI